MVLLILESLSFLFNCFLVFVIRVYLLWSMFNYFKIIPMIVIKIFYAFTKLALWAKIHLGLGFNTNYLKFI